MCQYSMRPTKKPPGGGFFEVSLLGRTGRAVDTQRIAHAEAVTLTGLVADVAGIKIPVHSSGHGGTDEVLQTVGHVSGQEPSVRVGQEVVHGVALGDRAVVLDGVDVVVGSANTQVGFQQTSSDEHQSRRDHQLLGLGCDQQAALIGPRSDLNHGVFQSGFVQIDTSGGAVAVGRAVHQRVSSAEQCDAITVGNSSAETVVQDRSALDLLGVRHATGQSLGVAAGQAVIQVVFDCFFSDGEAHGDGFVVVTGGPCFLRVVISDGLAFVLDRGGREARQLRFFLEGTLRSFHFVDFLVLFAVASVFQTEQGVQTREQLFEQLCA